MELSNINMLKLISELEQLALKPVIMKAQFMDSYHVFALEIHTFNLKKEPKQFNCSVKITNDDDLLEIIIPALTRLIETVRECKGIDKEYCIHD